MAATFQIFASITVRLCLFAALAPSDAALGGSTIKTRNPFSRAQIASNTRALSQIRRTSDFGSGRFLEISSKFQGQEGRKSRVGLAFQGGFRSVRGSDRGVVVRVSEQNEDDEQRRQELRNQLPGIIAMMGAAITLVDEAWVATTGCPPDFIGAQVERWAQAVVLSTFFCTMLAKMVLGTFLTDIIEGTSREYEKSRAALLLRTSEVLALVAVMYSAGVYATQVGRYGARLDIQYRNDRECYERARDAEYLQILSKNLEDIL